MKRMSLRSAELTERHQRAEADRASFHEREAVAKQRQVVERRDRQQMMGERERNRLRKLKAIEGREWDAEKEEDDYAPRTGRNFARGAHGGVVGSRGDDATTTTTAAPSSGAAAAAGFGRDQDDYNDGREYMYREGGRGRGGRGRGRGDHQRGGTGRGGGQGRPQAAPKPSDFPKLPTAAAATTAAATDPVAAGADQKTFAPDTQPVLSFPIKDGKARAEAHTGSTEAPSPSPAPAPPTPLDDTAEAGGKSWADMVESAA